MIKNNWAKKERDVRKEIASASFSLGNGGGRILYLGMEILARVTPLHSGLPPSGSSHRFSQFVCLCTQVTSARSAHLSSSLHTQLRLDMLMFTVRCALPGWWPAAQGTEEESRIESNPEKRPCHGLASEQPWGRTSPRQGRGWQLRRLSKMLNLLQAPSTSFCYICSHDCFACRFWLIF